VIRGLAGMKFSGSLNRFGEEQVRNRSRQRAIINPSKSFEE
jgi:hypothetical protein